MSEGYRRREGPVNLNLGQKQPKYEGQSQGDDAWKDYTRNLEKFRRTDDCAAEPNRGKGNESGQKP